MELPQAADSQPVLNVVKDALVIGKFLEPPEGPGVEVAKVNAGEHPLVDAAEFHHLLQSAQLVDLAHSLRAEPDMGKAVFIQGAQGLSQCVPR